MAKLPESERRKRVTDMIIGETRYIVPWALWVDLDNECYLNEDANVYTSANGAAKLKIIRVESGYIAFIHQVSYKWLPQSHHGFFDVDEKMCHGKVVGFELNKPDETKKSLKEQLEQAIAEENFELAKELQQQMK